MSESTGNQVKWLYLDDVDFSRGLSLQREFHKRVSFNDKSQGFLLLVQHKPVVTIGRFGKESNILLPENEMKKRGIEVWRIERGGDVTFHGPGQLVGYPIINLSHFQLGVKSYVQLLEEALISVLKKFGIEARRIKEHPGVWVGKEKVAAIGVYVKDSTSMHGFALNVNTDLDYFSLIVPCGISNMGVTSMKKILGEDIPLRQVAAIFAREFGAVFGANMRRHKFLE